MKPSERTELGPEQLNWVRGLLGVEPLPRPIAEMMIQGLAEIEDLKRCLRLDLQAAKEEDDA